MSQQSSNTHTTAPVEKEESSFAKWKKRFTSKSKPKSAEISASHGAIVLLQLSGMLRAAEHRTALRAWRTWRKKVDSFNQQQDRTTTNGNKPSRISVADPDHGSGVAMGLAAVYGSPLNRKRTTSRGETDTSFQLSPPTSPTFVPVPSATAHAVSLNLARSGSSGSAGGGGGSGPTASVLDDEAVRADYNQDPVVEEDENEKEEDDSEEETSATGGVPIPSKTGRSSSGNNAAAAAHAQSVSPRGNLMNDNKPNFNRAFSAGNGPVINTGESPQGYVTPVSPRGASNKGSHSTSSTRRSILGPGSAGSSGEASLTHSPWTSSRPVRPSIIHAARRGTLNSTSPIAPNSTISGHPPIHPSLMSPSMAFRKSIIIRDNAKAAATAGALSVSPPTEVPTSPARDSSVADGIPAEKVPHAMQLHPRGSVMLGSLADWSEKDAAAEAAKHKSSDSDINGVPPTLTSPRSKRSTSSGVRFADQDSGATTAAVNANSLTDNKLPPSELLGNAVQDAQHRRILVRSRWRGAIRQIMALALWARKRSSSRLAPASSASPDEEPESGSSSNKEDDEGVIHFPQIHAEDGSLILQSPPISKASSLAGASANTDATTNATAAGTTGSPSTGSSTDAAKLAENFATQQSHLLEYFLVYSLPSSVTDATAAELRKISFNDTTVPLPRRTMEAFVNEQNKSLEEQAIAASIFLQYPRVEKKKKLPVDPHWGAFGFPDSPSYSLMPRVNTCYNSVMTLADGMALFATYLRFDVPLLPNVAVSNAFPGVSPTAPTGSPTPVSNANGPAPSPEHLHLIRSTSTPVPSPSPPPLGSPPPPSSHTSPGSVVRHTHFYPHSSCTHLPPQLYAPQCLVLISRYPQLDVMRTIATQLFEVACLQQQNNSPQAKQRGKKIKAQSTGVPLLSLEAYLRALCYEIPLPVPKRYSVRFRIHRALCTVMMPGIRGAVNSALNLTTLFQTLNVDNIIGVLAAMLTENRILFHSTSLQLLTVIMQSFTQLFFPFSWWYAFVPHLTAEMLDATEIPQPYLIGLHSKHLPNLNSLDEVLIVDMDHDVLRSDHRCTPLPMKDGRDLWLSWRRSFEKIVIAKQDQVDDIRTVARPSVQTLSPTNHVLHPHRIGVLASPSPSPTPTASPMIGSSSTMSSSARRGSFVLPTTANAAANNNSNSSNSINMILPSSAYSFEEEIYAALLRFYAEILSGYKKFLFFISGCPFFNGQGFLAQRVAREPSSLEFYKKFVSSRALDVYIEQECTPDVYHEYLGNSGMPVNRGQSILFEEFGAASRIVHVPLPQSQEQQSQNTANNRQQVPQIGNFVRVEADIINVQSDEVLQTVMIDPPPSVDDNEVGFGIPESDASVCAVPFTEGMFGDSISDLDPNLNDNGPVRVFHWQGYEEDLSYYCSTIFEPAPRKPKQLENVGGALNHSHNIYEESESDSEVDNSYVSTSAKSSPPVAGARSVNSSPPSAHSSKASPPAVSSGLASNTLSPPNGKESLAASPHKRNHSAGSTSTGSHRHKRHGSDHAEQRMKTFLSEMFSSHTLSKEEMHDFQQFFNEANCRRSFVSFLNQAKQQHSSGGSTAVSGSGPNSSLCLTSGAFEQLTTLIKSLLDICATARDFSSASAGSLEIWNVFYKQDERRDLHTRVYLEAMLKSHPIFQNIEFWRANLAAALSMRALQDSNKTSPSQAGQHAAAGASNTSSDDEFILQWMISSVHQMMSCSVSPSKIESLVKEICASHHLAPAAVETILNFLSKIKEAAQYW